MARDDYYASAFGGIFSAYMERPRLSRAIGWALWGGDVKRYYESMAAIAELPAGGSVVDCPCGAGPAFRAAPASVRYVAVDLSPSMLRRARKRAAARDLPGVELVQADATDLPLPTESTDLFLSYWGLHCFPEPAAALVEAARVLKPDGRLVGAALVRGQDSLRQRLIQPGRGDFGRPGTQAEIESWLTAAGFETTDIERSGPMLFFDARKSPRA